MYGRGGGFLGATTIMGGIAVLPNTGSNILLTILDVVTMAAGVFILGSFIFTRIAIRFSN